MILTSSQFLGLSTLFYCLVQKRSWKAFSGRCFDCLLISWYVVPNVEQTLLIFLVLQKLFTLSMFKSYLIFISPIFWEPAEMFGGSRQARLCTTIPYIMFFFGGALIPTFFTRKKEIAIPCRQLGETNLLFRASHLSYLHRPPSGADGNIYYRKLIHTSFLLGGIYVRESITLRSVSNISQKPHSGKAVYYQGTQFLIIAFSHLVDRMATSLFIN